MGQAARGLLLVEDDDDSAGLFLAHAQRLGLRVTRAATGEEAVRIAPELHVDLAVVDLLLPGMSGWDVIDVLSGDESTAGCPIVVCSVLDRHDYPKGVQGVLPKPYTRRQIEQILRRLLPESGHR